MSTASVSAELKTCQFLVNGQLRTATGKGEVQINPATGEAVANIPYCSAAEVDEAVEAAARAFPSWSRTPILQRARVMFHFRDLMEKHAQELIALVTEENGKTLDEAKASYGRALEAVEFACSAPSLMMGEGVESVGSNADGYTVRKPIGVCVGITPFNFPLMVPTWMFPIAIACGNP